MLIIKMVLEADAKTKTETSTVMRIVMNINFQWDLKG